MRNEETIVRISRPIDQNGYNSWIAHDERFSVARTLVVKNFRVFLDYSQAICHHEQWNMLRSQIPFLISSSQLGTRNAFLS